ncbi:ATP-binding protein [Haloactinomyces albus]|uniref:Serine/threonine-protein kinase RsbW n=1 Tax=Haloactinomyces albus TaxID=1352928 RepID=A0AAE3ZAP8_9ACTN|nr:ATP-binding protein [Haloactinomyces albus]MDR7300465.1 serine/threonine-protein kinase RsbW [Haloactinomyces albus]
MSASDPDLPQVPTGEPEPSAAAPDPGAEPPVEVRVSAEATQLSVMRAVVGDLAMRADFDVDSIADLRLAVDEACSSLIRRAAGDAWLLCRFRCGADGLSLTAEVTSDESSAPRTDTFSWRVLSALTDTVASSVEAAGDGAGRHVVRIELRKGRTDTSDARGL